MGPPPKPPSHQSKPPIRGEPKGSSFRRHPGWTKSSSHHLRSPEMMIPVVNSNKRFGFNHGFKVDFVHPQSCTTLKPWLKNHCLLVFARESNHSRVSFRAKWISQPPIPMALAPLTSGFRHHADAGALGSNPNALRVLVRPMASLPKGGGTVGPPGLFFCGSFGAATCPYGCGLLLMVPFLWLVQREPKGNRPFFGIPSKKRQTHIDNQGQVASFQAGSANASGQR